jgi:hypothetical protein
MYMLRGDVNPWMFHQANLVVYDGVHSLLTNLLDATLAKYQSIYNVPVLGMSIENIGASMRDRMEFRAAGVSGVLAADGTITITAARNANVPLTGVSLSGAEEYGGEQIGYVNVKAGRTATVRRR